MKKACCPCPDVIGTRRWPFIRVPGLGDGRGRGRGGGDSELPSLGGW